jgi:hypothetical protein
MNATEARRLLAALEIALLRLEKRVDGNTDPSKDRFLHRRYGLLMSMVSELRQQLGTQKG